MDSTEDLSSLQDSLKSRIDGFLYRLEQRPLVGLVRKKYWFVLPVESPVLYWYKSSSDYSCAGKILLSGAAFTFNPREHGIFEIHADNKCHVLEAPNNKVRMEWLSSLRFSRKQYYQQSCGAEKSRGAVDVFDPNADNSAASASDKNDSGESPKSDNQQENCADENRSVFYLSENGELNPASLEVPPPIHSIGAGIDDFLTRVAEETQQLEIPAKKFLHKARNSIRTTSLSNQIGHLNIVCPQPRENCDRCAELVQSMEYLRNRCYELTDDLVVYQDLVNSLKKSVVMAHNQRDALRRCCMEASSDIEKLDFILERESSLAKMHFTVSELRRDNENMKEENRRLEAENSSLNSTVEAYQESIRTKESLILKYAEQQDSQNIPEAAESSSMRKKRQSRLSIAESSQPIPLRSSSAAEATEAILVDFGTPTDVAAKSVFTETAVDDLNEMKDLVDGYKNQNKFLNIEVLELQNIIQALEKREKTLITQNFNIEAVYYQLKSRYILLLNHLRSSDRPIRVIEPSLIQNLIDEVSRPHSPMRMHNSESLAIEIVRSTPSLATFVSCPQNIAIAAYADTTSGILQHEDVDTDSLGFFLKSPRTRKMAFQLDSSAGQKQEDAGDAADHGADFKQQPQQRQKSLAHSFSYSTTEKMPIPIQTKADGEQTIISLSASAPSTSFRTETTAEQGRSQPRVETRTPKGAAATNEQQQEQHQLHDHDDWLLRMAADLQKRSDDILISMAQGNNQEIVDWLQRWDAFLVNHVLQPLSPNPQLKNLVRCGIPHTYRNRVWTSLINHLVGQTLLETGKGYYECLLRKSQRPQMEEDPALRQIDLDLARTLPNNKLFQTEQSPKIGALKNILYAFRFHNKAVEYCQGLNRLGAIGLLYLDEPQAFWFLVACVEHLQPSNYYSSNLLGAVIDQRILCDLVQDKMPSLHAHLQRLEVDLSLFTLSWFLTVFVDVLSHTVYIKIFDVFLHEGNKVLFRFALAILKLAESSLLECTSLNGVHTCLTKLSSIITDYKILSNIAFNSLNPFPSKFIESRRQNYYAQHKNGKFKR